MVDKVRTAWRTVARYSIVRRQIGKDDVLIAQNKTFDEAQAIALEESRKLLETHGMKRSMARPTIELVLENEEEAKRRYREILNGETSNDDQAPTVAAIRNDDQEKAA